MSSNMMGNENRVNFAALFYSVSLCCSFCTSWLANSHLPVNFWFFHPNPFSFCISFFENVTHLSHLWINRCLQDPFDSVLFSPVFSLITGKFYSNYFLLHSSSRVISKFIRVYVYVNVFLQRSEG